MPSRPRSLLYYDWHLLAFSESKLLISRRPDCEDWGEKGCPSDPPAPPSPPWDRMVFSSRTLSTSFMEVSGLGDVMLPAPFLGSVNREVPVVVTRSHLSAQCHFSCFLFSVRRKQFYGMRHCASCHMTNTQSARVRNRSYFLVGIPGILRTQSLGVLEQEMLVRVPVCRSDDRLLLRTGSCVSCQTVNNTHRR